jgi:HSP20 family protein
MQDMMSRFHTRPFIEGFEWRPSTDVYEEEGKLLVRTEIPGIDPSEELTIEVEENVLHIMGEKTLEKEISEDNRYLRECRYGTFRRDVMLPEGVDADKIRANYDNGILTVMVPMPDEKIVEPRTVKVEVRTATTV